MNRKNKLIVNNNDFLLIKNKIEKILGIDNIVMEYVEPLIIFKFMDKKVSVDLDITTNSKNVSDDYIAKWVSNILKKQIIKQLDVSINSILDILHLNIDLPSKLISLLNDKVKKIENTLTPLTYEFVLNKFNIFKFKYNKKFLRNVQEYLINDIKRYFNENILASSLEDYHIFLYSGKEIKNKTWWFCIKIKRKRIFIMDFID